MEGQKEGRKKKEGKDFIVKAFTVWCFYLSSSSFDLFLYPVIFQQLSEPLRPPYVRVAGHSGL